MMKEHHGLASSHNEIDTAYEIPSRVTKIQNYKKTFTNFKTYRVLRLYCHLFIR